MESPKLRIGIIGAGTAGARHATALSKCSDALTIAIADPDRVRGGQLAASVNAQHFEDVSPAFWDMVDAVIISCPHNLLFSYALSAIEHQKPSLVEKPLALSLADIGVLEERATAAQIPVMVGFVHRFRSEAQFAHQSIQGGVVGSPTFAVEHLISGGGPTPNWIWQRSVAGGGVLLYNGVHGIDRLRWLLGREITQVYAETATRSRSADVEDIVVATLTFEGDISCSFVQHIAPYPLPSGWRSEIYGTDGALLFQPDGSVLSTGRNHATLFVPERDDRFLAEIEEFLAAIREQRKPAITIADGRAALAAAQAIYRSAETGQPVSLHP